MANKWTDWKRPAQEGQLVSEFTNPLNVQYKDGSYATADVFFGATNENDWYDFGFTTADIPDGATILGIEVNRYGRLNPLAADIQTRLVKAGILVGENKVVVAQPPSGTDSDHLLGGAADLWSTIWQPSNFHDTNFGVRILGTNVGDSTTLYIDQLSIRVRWALVEAREVEFRFSGGAGNFVGDSALGGVMSNDDVPTALLQALFDNVTDSEATAGDTEYRCYYLFNTNTGAGLVTARVYIQEETPSADTVIDIGLDPAGVGDGVATGVATTIANEGTAPAGVTFSHPTTFAGGLDVGAIGPGEGQAIWVRRTVSAAASSAPRDDVVIAHGIDNGT